MILCKVFYLTNSEKEQRINEWLEENKGISIVSTCTDHISERKSRLIIFYLV
jgi:hypothetical protein